MRFWDGTLGRKVAVGKEWVCWARLVDEVLVYFDVERTAQLRR